MELTPKMYERLRNRLIERYVRRGIEKQKVIDYINSVTDEQLYELMEKSRKDWESCGFE